MLTDCNVFSLTFSVNLVLDLVAEWLEENVWHCMVRVLKISWVKIYSCQFSRADLSQAANHRGDTATKRGNALCRYDNNQATSRVHDSWNVMLWQL